MGALPRPTALDQLGRVVERPAAAGTIVVLLVVTAGELQASKAPGSNVTAAMIWIGLALLVLIVVAAACRVRRLARSTKSLAGSWFGLDLRAGSRV